MRARHAMRLAVVLCGFACIHPAAAQSWPARPLTMVVPFAAGGGTDVLGRIVGRRLSEILGQQAIVENVGGAGGMVGSARVAKAPSDGYQFVLGSRADAINQTLYKNPLYNFAIDLAPVVLIADQPTILVARKDLPASKLPEFIAYARAHQATMQMGSAGAGSTGHLDCMLLNAAIGINVTSATAKPQIEAKLIKAIAILSRERSAMVPDLASAREQGLDFRRRPGSASFSPGARRSRSSRSFMTRPSRRWTRPPCRNGSRRSAPSPSRPSVAPPPICRNSSRARSRRTPHRSKRRVWRWSERSGDLFSRMPPPQSVRSLVLVSGVGQVCWSADDLGCVRKRTDREIACG
jgi:tripartite-type tricarboxylate transporter receptor subunit TctC